MFVGSAGSFVSLFFSDVGSANTASTGEGEGADQRTRCARAKVRVTEAMRGRGCLKRVARSACWPLGSSPRATSRCRKKKRQRESRTPSLSPLQKRRKTANASELMSGRVGKTVFVTTTVTSGRTRAHTRFMVVLRVPLVGSKVANTQRKYNGTAPACEKGGWVGEYRRVHTSATCHHHHPSITERVKVVDGSLRFRFQGVGAPLEVVGTRPNRGESARAQRHKNKKDRAPAVGTRPSSADVKPNEERA